MGRSPRYHASGVRYHVMARGNGGQDLFVAPAHWSRFRAVIARVKATSDFLLHAYCLMSNHVHLLIETRADTLSHVMHRIQTSWAKRYNLELGRKGHVFQDRFKAKRCEDDLYFRWLLRYIHRNPVAAGLCASPYDWEWSSYRQYLRGFDGLADTDFSLSLFGATRRAAIARLRVFIETPPEGGDRLDVPELFDSRELLAAEAELEPTASPRPDLRALGAEVCRPLGIEPLRLASRERGRAVCAARRRLARRAVACGYRTADVARFLEVAPQSVSNMLRLDGAPA